MNVNAYTAHQDAKEIADVYNQHGKAYHASRAQRGRFFNEFLEMPAALSLIPEDLGGKVLLDAGCGSGIYARAMAACGADVIAIDISETMIAIARQESSEEDRIAYQVGNLYALDVPSGSVDWIICNYVLENVVDVDAVFSEFRRVLKPGGYCVYSISHPLRATSEKRSLDGRDVWELKDYYNRDVRISDFGQGMKVKKYKRTLSDYINAAARKGLSIDRLLEPQPAPEGEACDAEAYAMAMRLPQLLVVRLVALA